MRFSYSAISPIRALKLFCILVLSIILCSCLSESTETNNYFKESTETLITIDIQESNIIYSDLNKIESDLKLDSLAQTLNLPLSREYLATSTHFYLHQGKQIKYKLELLVKASRPSNPIHQLSLIRLSRIARREGNTLVSTKYANRAYLLTQKYNSPIKIEAMQNLVLVELESRNLIKASKLLAQHQNDQTKWHKDQRNRHIVLRTTLQKYQAEDQFNSGQISSSEKNEVYQKIILDLEKVVSNKFLNQHELRYAYGNLGSAYIQIGESRRANDAFRMATNNLQLDKVYCPTLYLHSVKGQIFLDSLDAAEESMNYLAKHIRQDDLDTRIYYQTNLYRLKSLKHQYKEASLAAMNLATLISQLNNEKMLKQSADASARYDSLTLEYENNKLEIQNVENQNFIFLLITLLILFPGLIFLIGSLKRTKMRKEAIAMQSDLQHQLFNTQMNPHFLFNCLASVNALIGTDNKRKAREFVNQFSLLTRRVLESTKNETVPLEEEMEYLLHYIDIQKFRFGSELVVKVKYEHLELAGFKIPPLTLQPLVENCFIHAFEGINTTKEISIDCVLINQDDFVQIRINDNGNGLPSQNENSKKTSISTGLIERRFQLLQKKYKKTFFFERRNRPEEKGTEVLIKIEKL